MTGLSFQKETSFLALQRYGCQQGLAERGQLEGRVTWCHCGEEHLCKSCDCFKCRRRTGRECWGGVGATSEDLHRREPGTRDHEELLPSVSFLCDVSGLQSRVSAFTACSSLSV